MIEYALRHIFSYNAVVAHPEVIGLTPEGFRVTFYLAGGEVTGPAVRGKLRPGGADWFTLRADGVGILDVRTTIETHDGALIYVEYNGVVDLGPDGYERFLQGTPPPPGTPIRTAPRCATTHPDYRWLNRLQCLGIGQSFVAFTGRSEVVYDVYAVE